MHIVRLQSDSSVTLPMYFLALLLWTVFGLVLVVLPTPQVTEQSDQGCQDPHEQSTKMEYKDILH